MELNFDIKMISQPTEVTCGATCLNAIYHYLNDFTDLQDTVNRIPQLTQGGTLAVHLAQDALFRNYDVSIFTHNLKVFDPTWFSLEANELSDKLIRQSQTSKAIKTITSSVEYASFIRAGGQVLWKELNEEFIYGLLKDSGPFIAGLSATYLYWSMREFGPNCEYNDIEGDPQGHFVVICGISSDLSKVYLADPHKNNPLGGTMKYAVSTRRLINSTLMGVITYDANFIQIKKKAT